MTRATPSSSLVAVRPRGGGQRVRVGVAHGEGGAGPAEHLDVVGHVAEGDHLGGRDAALGTTGGECGGFGDAESADLQERGRAGAGDGRPVAGRRTGQVEERVGRQLAVVGQQLEHGRAGARGVLVEQLLGDGDRGTRVQVERRVGRFVVDAGGHLDGEGGAGGRLAQGVHDMEGGVALQRPYGEEVAVRPQVGDHGAVGADRRAVALDVVPHDVHPAGRPAGDEEDLDPGLLGRREGRDGACGQGLVVAQQGAVEVGGDQPGHGGKRRIGH